MNDMDPRLAIFVCETFTPEVIAALREEGFSDVEVRAFPLNCGSPLLSAEELMKMLNEASTSATHMHYLGSSCIQLQHEASAIPDHVSVTQLPQCFDILIPSDLTSRLISEKKYLVSSGWLPFFKQQIFGWGFDQETARKFFRESASELLLVETGVGKETDSLMGEISQFIDMPFSTLHIGLCHCRLQLRGIVLGWRYRMERETTRTQMVSLTRKTADYSMAFDQISELAQVSDETEIMHKISKMITLLFAPKRSSYIPAASERKKHPVVLIPPPAGRKTRETKETSFSIQVLSNNENIGRIEVVDVMFPQYIDQYQTLSPILGKLFGLVISNAKRYETIKRHEEQLQANSNDLASMNAVKDKFFSIIAHDLRNPFNAMFGFINLFLDGYDEFSDPEKLDFMHRIQKISQNTYRLIENLLDWARTQTGKYEPQPVAFSLQKMMLDNIDIFLPGASHKNIRIRLESTGDLMVFADKYSLDAVIRNLISNAVKFTKPGGEIRLNFHRKNKMVHCSVSDNGIGMSAMMVDQLFRLDTTVSRKGTDDERGTGLGLILCKEYVEMNGGKIGVTSEEGKGTRFFFTIPLFDRPGDLDE